MSGEAAIALAVAFGPHLTIILVKTLARKTAAGGAFGADGELERLTVELDARGLSTCDIEDADIVAQSLV